MVVEKGKWRVIWKISKFKDPDREVEKSLKAGMAVNDVVKEFRDRFISEDKFTDNMLLNSGITEMWNLIIGASANHFDNANAQIGVGDSTDAEDAAQTDLLGTNTAYGGMDTGYPSVSGNTVTFRATFGSGEANFDWNEYVVKKAVSGICLNRKVESKGTKVSGETWTISVQISLS